MINVKFYDSINDEKIKFAVIVSSNFLKLKFKK